MKTVAVTVLILLSLSCEKAVVEYFSERIVENTGRIASYAGTVVERGLLPGDTSVRTEVCFERAGKFTSRVVSPPQLEGNTVRIDGDTLSMYYPAPRFGIIFTHMSAAIPDSPDKRTARLREFLASRSREHSIIWRGNAIIAGRRAYHFTSDPRQPAPRSIHEEFWGDEEFSFPLKGRSFSQ